jgi:hypothetical protein
MALHPRDRFFQGRLVPYPDPQGGAGSFPLESCPGDHVAVLSRKARRLKTLNLKRDMNSDSQNGLTDRRQRLGHWCFGFWICLGFGALNFGFPRCAAPVSA